MNAPVGLRATFTQPLFRRIVTAAAASSLVGGLLAAPALAAPHPSPESRFVPAPDCTAHVGMPQSGALPAYRVPDARYGHVCLGFTQVPLAPAGYRGDYRVDAFTDTALRRAYATCRTHTTCAADAQLTAYRPETFRHTGTVVAQGRVDPYAARVDLRAIRRPIFFGAPAYREHIAAAEGRTTTVNIAVPAERYDVEHGHPEAAHLRGWFLAGTGVPDRRGVRQRALAVLVAGRTVETTSAQEARDTLYVKKADGTWATQTYPKKGSTTEAWGGPAWRSYLSSLNEAGFDVLTLDKRGHGISGGRTADNTFQQGLDMLRSIDVLKSGRGLRTLGPDGRERSGRAAADAIASRRTWSHLPIVLGGSSQGSYTTQWAMNANLHRWCEVDRPGGGPCHRPWGIPNIRGAMLLAALPGFPRAEPEQASLEGGRRARLGLVRYPSTEPLAHIADWPAVFFAKGLADDVSGPLGTFDAYRRADPATRDLIFVRGPHSEVSWGPAAMKVVQRRMVAFAQGAVTGRPVRGAAYRTLRDAAAASPPLYAPTTSPTRAR